MTLRFRSAVLFAPIQAICTLIALALAYGGLFLLYAWLTAPTGAADVASTYRIFLTSFSPNGAMMAALGVSAATAQAIGHLVLTGMLVLMSNFFIQLALFVRAAAKDQPFSSANAKRLDWMGWCLIFTFGLCEGGIALFMGNASFDQWVLIGLFTVLGGVFLVLALVFRHGIAITQDLEGTV